MQKDALRDTPSIQRFFQQTALTGIELCDGVMTVHAALPKISVQYQATVPVSYMWYVCCGNVTTDFEQLTTGTWFVGNNRK